MSTPQIKLKSDIFVRHSRTWLLNQYQQKRDFFSQNNKSATFSQARKSAAMTQADDKSDSLKQTSSTRGVATPLYSKEHTFTEH